jgi:hypothetical protein
VPTKNLFDEEGKKYVINESSRDFFGRKKYKVTESKDSTSSGFGSLILALIFIALLTLPAGNLSLLLYLLVGSIAIRNYTGDSLQNFKETIAWLIIAFSVLIIGILYYKFWENLSSNLIMNSCVSGLFSYYILYEVVLWGQRSEEKKKKITMNLLIFCVGLIAVLFYNQYDAKKKEKINKEREEYIKSEKFNKEFDEWYNKSTFNK